jgi:hypothetical protein
MPSRRGPASWMVCRDVGVDPAGAGSAPTDEGTSGRSPGLGCRDAGGSNPGRPVSHAQSSPEALMSIGGHASQRPARIGCPKGGMRSGCCKPVFQHPGFHVRRETSTAGGHRGNPRQRPRRAARAQDAPAAPGHRPLCSQDPRAKSRTGTAAATAATAWVTAVEMCATRARSTGAGEQDDELHMLWPGIGIGARRSWRDEGRPSERSHAIRAAARSGQRDAVR